VPRRRGRHTIDHHHKQREDAAPSSNRPSLCL
jgi:hypothetical protein